MVFCYHRSCSKQRDAQTPTVGRLASFPKRLGINTAHLQCVNEHGMVPSNSTILEKVVMSFAHDAAALRAFALKRTRDAVSLRCTRPRAMETRTGVMGCCLKKRVTKQCEKDGQKIDQTQRNCRPRSCETERHGRHNEIGPDNADDMVCVFVFLHLG